MLAKEKLQVRAVFDKRAKTTPTCQHSIDIRFTDCPQCLPEVLASIKPKNSLRPRARAPRRKIPAN